MKTIFAVWLLLFAVPATFAQTADKTVEKIRAVYGETSEKVRLAETDDDQGEYGDLIMNELVVNKRSHQWRAVGIFQETYKFFYKTTGEDLYPETLVMIKVGRRVSDRSYREEYLYDEKGALLFSFQKAENDNQVPAERRVYFSAGRAVRVIEDTKKRDRLTAGDLKTVREITTESFKIKEIFSRSVKL